MSRRAWLAYGLLVVVASAFALLTRTGSDEGGQSVPSVTNTRGGGLAALKLYLDELGAKTATLDEELTKTAWITLVIAEPEARALSEAEVDAIEARVKAGGTLVYLSASQHAQPKLNSWLKLERRGRISNAATTVDPGGATARVYVAEGPFVGLRELRVSADVGVASDDPAFVTVAGTDQAAVLLWKKLGKGQLIVASGADLAENRRIELLDNRKLWENLAGLGPITFDEFHHQRAPEPPISVGLLAFGAQALFAVIFLTFARGTRLGPPRPLVPQRHRAGVEYAQSFAWLTRSAHVEKELARDVYDRLRRLIHDRLGVPLTLPAAEFGREVEVRLNLATGTWSQLEGHRDAETPKDFSELSKRAAEIEQQVRGATR